MSAQRPHHVVIKTLLLLFIFSLALNTILIYREYVRNTVSFVVDGDSFELKDGRRIRLLGIDAPELTNCLGEEAKNYLTGLVSDKHVSLEDIVIDDYGRILANVYVGDLFINENILSSGMARFTYVGDKLYQTLKDANNLAKKELRGIYSDTCRNLNPITDCLIKGNIRAAKKTYHLPSCDNYDQTIIDASFGDAWFCTEKEAISAGFEKATGCPESVTNQ